jgi:protein ImuB
MLTVFWRSIHMLRRTACIDIPDLPLQILMREHPDWRDAPVALVAEERPEAELLLVNRHARTMRLRTGMRFGAAKSLLPELRVGCVSALAVEQTAVQLVRDLQTFSPHVERDPVSPGVFYVDPSGLSHLYGGELSWARAVQRFLLGRHFYAAGVVAYGRAFSYALARVTRGVRVIDTQEDTLSLALQVPLMRLHIAPKLRDSLERLGLSTLGDLRGFGADQLGVRFGAEAARLCRVAQGEEVLSLCREAHVDTPHSELEVDPPDDDVARLCFVLKRVLDALLENVRQRGQSVRALWMRLSLLRSPVCAQRLEPSAPTRDATLLLELLRLRLSTLRLESAVVNVALEAETCDLAEGQLSMFVPKRDLAAGERALARIKASFGEDTVCHAELVDAHLPEAQFRWVSATRLTLPKPEQPLSSEPCLPLIRRLLKKPEPFTLAHYRALGWSRALPAERSEESSLEAKPNASAASPAEGWDPASFARRAGRARAHPAERSEDLEESSLEAKPNASAASPAEGWDPSSFARRAGRARAHPAERSEDLKGPYRVSGGWWAKEVARDYYYARNESGALWWVFYDVLRASWFLQATVD